jgi:hypothetical protein
MLCELHSVLPARVSLELFVIDRSVTDAVGGAFDQKNSGGATLAPLAVTLSVLGLSEAGSQFSPLEFLQLGHECLGGDDCKTHLVADI